MAEENTKDLEKELEKKKADKEKTRLAAEKAEFAKKLKEEIEGARKEEKDKLYGDLKKMKDELAGVADIKAKFELEKKEAEDKLEKERQEKLTMEEKINEMRGETESAFDRLGQSFEEKMAKQFESMRKLETTLSQSQLEAFKEKELRKLSEDNIGYIPELIGGETPEDIQSSIKLSAQKYKEIAEQVKGTKLEGDRYKFPTVTSPNNASTEGEDEVLDNVRNLRPTDDKNFGAHADAMRQQYSDEFRKMQEARNKIKEELKARWVNRGQGGL